MRDRVVLVAGPVIYLGADLVYALRGWDSPAAGVLHVLGATAYAVLVFTAVGWFRGPLAVVLLVVGALGAAGNIGYGFNTIHVSLGDTDLNDASGAAVLIKVLGLCFPLSLLLIAGGLRWQRIGPGWVAVAVAVAAVGWPVAHIANVGWLAIVVNVVLVAAFGALAFPGADAARRQDARMSSVAP
ncbi:hypothetical protein [Cryptosporangium phraense]|uniref:Uncharacterized protein n=1 Tax=Cryptosporangium phraense TaxID=2593070 RepID=A0A545AMN4_9ACTN|nr:hypothetical protein [Cryptosporangium phraense]TQS42589.1 hypothetical protein FL583_23130 [Cryptosporangium phraense]